MKENKTEGTKVSEMLAKAKAKMEEVISSMKTKEGREAFVTKVKKTAIAAKDKTVVLWKSGPKGKAAIVGIALVLAWIILPFGGDESSTVSEGRNDVRAMSNAGLKKMHDGDAMFYESGEKFKIDDNISYDIVKPNLYVLPPFIKSEYLETAVYPTFEKEKGDAFAPQIGGLEVISVCNGYVLVGMFNDVSQGWFYAYVKTSDEYVDGQPIKEGYYAYTGTQTVPMADGSSRTVPAFEKLDDAYIAAVAYNAKAQESAEAENDRRANEATGKADVSVKDSFVKMVLEMAKETEEESFAKRIHVPAKLRGKAKVKLEARWKWVNDPARTTANFIGREEFVSRMEKGELPYFLAAANRYDTAERMRNEIDDYYRRYRIVAEIQPGARLAVYTIHPKEGVKMFDPRYSSDDLFDGNTNVAVVEMPDEQKPLNPTASECDDTENAMDDNAGSTEDPPEDPKRAFQTSNVMQFLEAYEKIYGE